MMSRDSALAKFCPRHYLLKLGRWVGHEALGAEVSRSVEVGGILTDSIKGHVAPGLGYLRQLSVSLGYNWNFKEKCFIQLTPSGMYRPQVWPPPFGGTRQTIVTTGGYKRIASSKQAVKYLSLWTETRSICSGEANAVLISS